MSSVAIHRRPKPILKEIFSLNFIFAQIVWMQNFEVRKLQMTNPQPLTVICSWYLLLCSASATQTFTCNRVQIIGFIIKILLFYYSLG